MDEGSRKLGFSGGYNVPLEANPFSSELRVLDCGDIPVTSYVYPTSYTCPTRELGSDTNKRRLATTTPTQSNKSSMAITPS
jgi:hypothetical protein